MTTHPTWQPPHLLPEPRTAVISARQADVLSGLCRGKSNAEIGRDLYLTENSVKTHARRLYRALGARDRAHAAALAASRQLTIVVTGAEA